MISFESYLENINSGGVDKPDELIESTVSRFVSKFKKYDACIITAYRDMYTKKENQQRNKELFSALYTAGYSITSVKGSYIENFKSEDAKEVGEHSFVVVNHKEASGFHKTLINLGKKYDQDSVLLIHKGESPKAELFGTSKRDNSYPSYGKSETMNKMLDTVKGAQFFTKLRNQGFAFIDVNESQYDCDEYLPESRQSKHGCILMGERILALIEDIE